jgi:7,8-dihydropterin-6-yl-methyl-4-(beta-D-ribofuranosyl)aminobenzene 5'-phosphate synthase
MTKSVRIQVVIENKSMLNWLQSEHGFSVLLDTDDSLGLFDTGASNLVWHNLETLGYMPSQIDWICLSHGHWDHVGGLEIFAKQHPNLNPHLILHKHALEPTWIYKNNQWTNGGFNIKPDILKSQFKIRYVSKFTEILPCIWVSGEIPRTTEFEKIAHRFATGTDIKNLKQETFPDDICMVINGASGLFVILGCTHSGIINTLKHVKVHFPKTPIQAIMGGLHLVESSSENIGRTVEELKTFNISKFYLGHCTGKHAMRKLKACFSTKILTCHAGLNLKIDLKQ